MKEVHDIGLEANRRADGRKIEKRAIAEYGGIVSGPRRAGTVKKLRTIRQ